MMVKINEREAYTNELLTPVKFSGRSGTPNQLLETIEKTHVSLSRPTLNPVIIMA